MVGLRFWPTVGVRTGGAAVGAEVDVRLGGAVGGTEVAVGGTAVAVGGGGGTVAVGGSAVGTSVGTMVDVTVADGATVAEGSTVAVSAGRAVSVATAVADRVAVTRIVGSGVRSPPVDVGVAERGVVEAAPVVPRSQNPTA